MLNQKNGTAIFELSGESLEAAKRLEDEIRKELETVKPMNSGNMLAIQKSWESFYKGLVARLQQEQPGLLAQTGLAAPAVQVQEGKDSLPRAYVEFPAIFSSPEEEPRYFMYVPVDYKGDYFKPEDGAQVDDAKAAQIDDLLFAGGWLGNAPLVTMTKEGTATPADYAPAPEADGEKTTHTRRTFVAGGESLAAIGDYEQRQREYRAACERARKAIEKIAELGFPELQETAPAGETLRASVSYRYGGHLEGKTEMLLSVRMEGTASMWNAGKTLPLQDNAAWTLKQSHGNEYVVEPRRDTPAGQALARIMDAIPSTPSLSEYPVLLGDFSFRASQIENALGVNGIVPQVRELGGKKILVYNTEDDDTRNFTPQGAKPLSTKVFNWLDADERDRNMGYTPPPMPPVVKAALAGPKPPQGPRLKF